MKSQLEYVKKHLDNIYQVEVDKINTRKEKLEDRSKELQQFVQNRQNIEEKVANILKQGGASNVVRNIADFLNTSHIEQTFPEEQIRKIQYIEPIYNQALNDEIFQIFLREHVLGSMSDVVLRPHDSVPSVETRAQPVSKTNVKNKSPLRRFSNSLLKGDSMFVCGWIKGRFWYYDYIAVFDVQTPEYNFILKQRIKDSQAGQPLLMCAFDQRILVARKGGSEVHCFGIHEQQVSTLNTGNVAVMAMCGNADYVYILDNSRPHRINIFDSDFEAHGNITTVLEGVKDANVDMSIIHDDENPARHIAIISSSFPQASVRAIDQTGVLWQLDCRTCPDQIDLSFNPCSVTASCAGDIFIADREGERVSNI